MASGSELKRRMKRNHDDDKEESDENKLQSDGNADVEMEVEMAEHGGSGYEDEVFSCVCSFPLTLYLWFLVMMTPRKRRGPRRRWRTGT